ncbi:MAG: hypothetical protein RLZZ244_453, partial [Verrucomicrobiota bacterium]
MHSVSFLRGSRWIRFALAFPLATSLIASPSPQTLSYNRDIRPILSDACFHCHGPDEKQRKGNLRLDLASEAVKPAKSGAIAIVPGKPAESELLVRTDTSELDEIMPPPKAHKKLSEAQKTLLRKWIEQGAVYEKHWAFVPLAPVEIPTVQNPSWTRNPVDNFILHRLEQEKLPPSPEASKATLLRRVSLDLTGLPPTPSEQNALLADSSPNAYESAVERLLASPRYGERMAVDWLDAARYADTNGYQIDRNRELWAWRDWVIQAFNRNLRFDQFTIEQIAGDLLPNPTREQRIATGFHRNHMINEEGGSIDQEFLAEYTADRVETTASVWLAQTFNCARCHDHKYDPISQKDFYALKAFFHNLPEKGIAHSLALSRLSSPPFLKLPAPEIEARIAALQSQIRSTESQIAALSKTASETLDAWTLKIREPSVSWTPLAWNSATAGKNPLPIHGNLQTARLEPTGTGAETLKLKLQLPPSPPSALRIEVATESSAVSLSLSSIKAFLSPKSTASKRAPLALRGSAEGLSLSATDAAKVATANPKAQVLLAPKPDAPAAAVFEFSLPESHQNEGELELEITLRSGATAPTFWQVLATGADRELLVPDSLRSVAAKEPSNRTPKETQQLVEFQLSQRDDHRQLSSTLAELRKTLRGAEDEIPTTL